MATETNGLCSTVDGGATTVDEDSVGLDDVSSFNKPVTDMFGSLALLIQREKEKNKKKKVSVFFFPSFSLLLTLEKEKKKLQIQAT